ncbi:MAG: hypothetical protein II269_04625, partial [Bacteroidaceae bacterium]|nr:hypothetical protein [Bacteroidaceae bacterium]
YMDKYLVTTPGKILFNEIFPDTFQYISEGTSENIEKITPAKFFLEKGVNIPEAIKEMPLVDAFAKGVLSKLIAQIYKRYQTTETSVMLDKLKDLGFKYSTLSGISIAISDIKESQKKPEIIANSQALVDQVSSATGSSATGSSATGSSATGSSATGSSATGSSAMGSSATGSSATGSSITCSSEKTSSGTSAMPTIPLSSGEGLGMRSSSSGEGLGVRPEGLELRLSLSTVCSMRDRLSSS